MSDSQEKQSIIDNVLAIVLSYAIFSYRYIYKVCKYMPLQPLDLLQRILKMATWAIRTTTDKLQLSVPITPR
ncbi:hypothetical protein [Nostoc sp.]|uniref:hypothetical protein n=1 Tax=Nostoc sp. TaxID=1180 RepID=UPI002FF7DEC6